MADFRGPGLIARIAMPLRGMGQRFALGSLILAAFGLMLFHSGNAQFVERLRTTVTDVTAPILEVAAEPVQEIWSTVVSSQHPRVSSKNID